MYMFWLLSYILLAFTDVYYIARGIFLYLYTNFRIRHKGYKDPLKESCIQSICTTNDLDFNFHMNNGRYLRECDFGRFKLWLESGIYDATRKLGGGITLGGINCRYRKSLQLFQTFKIRTKIICWDQRAFYLEQRVERNKDNFVCAVAYMKQTIINLTPSEVLKAATGTFTNSPPIPDELAKWIEANQISSEKMRPTTLKS